MTVIPNECEGPHIDLRVRKAACVAIQFREALVVFATRDDARLDRQDEQRDD
jgi:hypothetical protein